MNALPQDPLKLMSLAGALCSDLGLHDRALVIFEHLVLLREEDPNVLVSLAVAHSRAGDEPTAQATLRRALEFDPGHDMARVMLAIHLNKAGDLDARAMLRDVLSSGRDADALALASSVQEEVLSSPTAAEPPAERLTRHRYTRVEPG
jgi:Flp pilus assembly protein TadD